MGKIKIFTDSASDISFEAEKDLNIGMVNFSVALGDNAYISREDFDNQKFYEMMESYDGVPLTAQVTSFAFMELYEKYYEEGYSDVIGILINREASATYDNSIMGYNMFLEEHPEAEGKFKVYSLDGRSYTGAYGYAVIESAKMAEAGKTAEEIVAFAEDWLEHCMIYFAPYSLTYAGKSGRIPSAAALVGNRLGIKPVMRIYDHKITTEATIRGEKRVVKKIAEKTMADMKAGAPYLIVYGNDPEVRDQMKAEMIERTGYEPADIYQIGAAIASNSGPRVVGVIFREK